MNYGFLGRIGFWVGCFSFGMVCTREEINHKHKLIEIMRKYKKGRSKGSTLFKSFGWKTILPKMALPLCMMVGISGSALADVLIADSAEERDRIINQIQASRFLHQATFGPSWSDIEELADEIEAAGGNTRRAFRRWINRQIALPFNSSIDDEAQRLLGVIPDDPRRNDFDGQLNGFQVAGTMRENALWRQMLKSEDQLRQRMAYALSQILTIGTDAFNNSANQRWRGAAIYYDLLLEHSFGNYRDLLSDITFDPLMGTWLDHAQNQPADPSINRFPDENYAREFLQLFTVGVFRLNESGEVLRRDGRPVFGQGQAADELYGNETIREFARVFTGLTYAERGRRSRSRSFLARAENLLEPMEMDNNFHEAGAKTLLDGFRTPGGAADGIRDINLAIDNAFNHSNCPPFISKLLIQRFTTSNPSTEYVNSVVQAFKGNARRGRGDLGRVLRAILLNDEARNSLQITSNPLSGGRWEIRVSGRDDEHGKMREPFIHMTAMLRAFEVRSSFGDGTYRLGNYTSELNQHPQDATGVFNFYLPDHQPVGAFRDAGLVAPEFEIFTFQFANSIPNTVRDILRNRSGNNVRNLQNRSRNVAGINISQIRGLLGNPQECLDRLDILFCAGTLDSDAKDILMDQVVRGRGSANDRVEALLSSIIGSPDFAVNN